MKTIYICCIPNVVIFFNFYFCLLHEMKEKVISHVNYQGDKVAFFQNPNVKDSNKNLTFSFFLFINKLCFLLQN